MKVEGRVLYHNGMVTVTELTDNEKEMYRKLKPGVYLTEELIRSVAVEDGKMQVLETSENGVNRIRFKL